MSDSKSAQSALDDAREVLKAWDDFCSRHPEKYPSEETIKQRELLHGILCIRCVQAVRELTPKCRICNTTLGLNMEGFLHGHPQWRCNQVDCVDRVPY